MGKQARGRKAENNVGKGKVTPVQVAFIVDRYLADNNYSETRSIFRSEASSLIPKSSIKEAPKSLLSLGAMLDEYISLKEQKVMVDQEKCRLEQERCRIQTLLQGMQTAMDSYNSSATINCLTSPPPPTVVPSSFAKSMVISSSSGYPVQKAPIMTSLSMTHGMRMEHSNFSTPIITSRPPRKRKNYKDLRDASQAPKKYCTPLPNNQLSNQDKSVAQSNNASNGVHISQASSPNFANGGSPIQVSSVAKNLFSKPSQSPTSNSSGPKTPPRAASSQSDKSTSPLEEVSSTAMSHGNHTSQETTPTNCTIISSKTIIMSPAKHYSIERNHCSFSSPSKTNLKRQNKRDHVKGRLDFDGSDVPTSLENVSEGTTTSESDKEGDIFDLDLPNFDAFGPDFSLTELLTDFGIDCGAFDYSCPSTIGASIDEVPQTLLETNNRELGTSQDLLDHSSATTEVFAGDMSINGADSITSVKSITKCIRIVSPTKSSHKTAM